MIISNGLLSYEIIKGKQKSAKYAELIKYKIQHIIKPNAKNDFLFQHNNYPIHISMKSLKLFNESKMASDTWQDLFVLLLLKMNFFQSSLSNCKYVLHNFFPFLICLTVSNNCRDAILSNRSPEQKYLLTVHIKTLFILSLTLLEHGFKHFSNSAVELVCKNLFCICCTNIQLFTNISKG